MTLSEQDRSRIVNLAGAGNFRDFGGYETACGRVVKTGMLFRSNRLSQLSNADMKTLDQTGITNIFDLRAPREREADPTVWKDGRLTTYTYRPGHKRRLVDMAMDYSQTEDGAKALMSDFYAELPITLGHAFGDIIVKIAHGALPCVIHCSAGKDRTGMAAALILAALDVPRDTILGDYTLTDRIVASEDDMARSLFVGRDGGDGAKEAMRGRFSSEAIAIMRSAKPEFLDSAFAGLESKCGTLEAYFDSVGVTPHIRDRLKQRLVEPSIV